MGPREAVEIAQRPVGIQCHLGARLAGLREGEERPMTLSARITRTGRCRSAFALSATSAPCRRALLG